MVFQSVVSKTDSVVNRRKKIGSCLNRFYYYGLILGQTMNTFSDIVEEADKLTLEEQETFIEILQKRVSETKRNKLIKKALESSEEFGKGHKLTSSIDDIMKEIAS